jgi:hypothetical protein
MTAIRTMDDLSTFPLEFKEPIPGVLQEGLSPAECSKLVCVTTTAALKEWMHFRMHGAGYKSSRSFATQFLREAHKRADQLFEYWPACYLCVFLSGDDKQPGRLIVHMIRETTDFMGKADIEWPAPNYFDFGGDGGVLSYLIYTEYLDQKGLLAEQA